MVDYIRDLRPAKWGSGVRLQGNNFKPLMSALGQKETLGVDLSLESFSMDKIAQRAGAATNRSNKITRKWHPD